MKFHSRILTEVWDANAGRLGGFSGLDNINADIKELERRFEYLNIRTVYQATIQMGDGNYHIIEWRRDTLVSDKWRIYCEDWLLLECKAEVRIKCIPALVALIEKVSRSEEKERSEGVDRVL